MRYLLRSTAIASLCFQLCFAHAAKAQTPDASPSPTLWQTLKCDQIVANIKKRAAMTSEQISRLPAPPEDENARFSSCLHVAPRAPSAAFSPPPSPYHVDSKTKLQPPPPPSSNPSSSVDDRHRQLPDHRAVREVDAAKERDLDTNTDFNACSLRIRERATFALRSTRFSTYRGALCD